MVALTDLVFDASASTNEIHEVHLLKLTTICIKEVAGVGGIRTSKTAATKISTRLIWMQHLGAQPIAYSVIIKVHKVLITAGVIPCGIAARS